MRKLLCLASIFVVLLLVLLAVVVNNRSSIYTIDGVIYKVYFDEDLTVFMDSRGEVWYWEGTEVPIAGTRVILTMDTNNNDWLIDDMILSFKAL